MSILQFLAVYNIQRINARDPILLDSLCFLLFFKSFVDFRHRNRSTMGAKL